MPELRVDPIMGRRVYVAEDRAGRPTDFSGPDEPRRNLATADVGARRPDCPFCAGNESATPHAAATVLDEQGQWQVRVVPNKFPAVTLGDGDGAFGAHEVIIESPDHCLELTSLAVDQWATVLGVYRDRLRHYADDGRFKHALVFKNSGFAAGASLLHVHSQVIALPYVPDMLQAELDGAAQRYQTHGRCAFCRLVEDEIAAGDRLVLRDGGVVAFCALAGRQPYETWILPERHASRFETIDDDQRHALAAVMHATLRRLHAVSPGVSYNLMLHTGPFDGAAGMAYHWHWELVPRLAYQAGLEWGAGVFINPLSPERAAQQLRQVL